MELLGHPRVVVGVDGSLSGLAAIRAAVDEARRRRVPLNAVRAGATGVAYVDASTISATFLEALGSMPSDIRIEQKFSTLSIREALCLDASDPRDLIVVGSGNRGFWHTLWFGSIARSLTRCSRCPVLAVPAPEIACSPPHARGLRRRAQWDPLRQLELERPELHGRPYSGA
jgi:nucleotide-binding universal stress UspA family protein